MRGKMPTFKGPKAERIRAYMFDSGEGIWLCPGLTGQHPFISPRSWGDLDQSFDITEKEYGHAKRILKLEMDDYASF